MMQPSDSRPHQLARAVADTICDHWLTVANLCAVAYAALAVAAPLLDSAGHATLAGRIYVAYGLVCHQLPDQSWFVVGHQMAFCQRDTAIYGTLAVAGIVYQFRRRWTTGLTWWLAVAMTAPIALDGGTVLVGWRESDPYLRTVTGVLFGIVLAWFVYPVFDRSLAIAVAPRRPTTITPGVST